MKIVVKKAGQMPEVLEVENDLSVFQWIVGGHMETVSFIENILCVCNEEGKLMGLPVNFILHDDYIVGDVFFCAFDGEDFASLEEYQIAALMNAFTLYKRNEMNNNWRNM